MSLSCTVSEVLSLICQTTIRSLIRGVVYVLICVAALIQLQLVADRRTDRRSTIACDSLVRWRWCIVISCSHAAALCGRRDGRSWSAGQREKPVRRAHNEIDLPVSHDTHLTGKSVADQLSNDDGIMFIVSVKYHKGSPRQMEMYIATQTLNSRSRPNQLFLWPTAAGFYHQNKHLD